MPPPPHRLPPACRFFFEPTRAEMAAALRPLFAPQLNASAVDTLLDAFGLQPMDFFGAIKSRLADDAVRAWLKDAGMQVWCGRVRHQQAAQL